MKLALLLSGALLIACSPADPSGGDDAGAVDEPAAEAAPNDAAPACVASSCSAPPHASAKCVQGACGFVCQSGWADCDGNASNGCEVSLETSAHCGSCGHDCEGASCTSGVCAPETLLSGLSGVVRIAADGTDVYYADTKQIGACGRDACPSPKPVYAPTYGVDILSLAVDTTDVWSIATSGHEIDRCAKTGCTIQTAVVPNRQAPYGLVVTSQYLVWAEGQVLGTTPQQPALLRANKDGTGLTTLSQGLSYSQVTVYGSTIYFLDGSSSTGGVRSCPITDCSNPTPILPDAGPVNFNSLWVDASGAYAMENARTFFAKLGSATDQDIGPSSSLGTNSVAVGSWLFWGDRQAGALDALPKSGAASVTVRAPNLGVPQEVAGDATAAYVTTADGKIVKLVP